LQLPVLRLGFLQDGDVGVGVFPEGGELLVGVDSHCWALPSFVFALAGSRDPEEHRFHAGQLCFRPVENRPPSYPKYAAPGNAEGGLPVSPRNLRMRLLALCS
jgi:hypothetical protein